MRIRESYTDEEWENFCRDDTKCITTIEQALWDMGYDDVCSQQDAVDTIRMNHIDISQFKLPYASQNLEEWQSEINRIQKIADSGKMTASDLKRPDVAI